MPFCLPLPLTRTSAPVRQAGRQALCRGETIDGDRRRVTRTMSGREDCRLASLPRSRTHSIPFGLLVRPPHVAWTEVLTHGSPRTGLVCGTQRPATGSARKRIRIELPHLSTGAAQVALARTCSVARARLPPRAENVHCSHPACLHARADMSLPLLLLCAAPPGLT
jgi:hypothetical protein